VAGRAPGVGTEGDDADRTGRRSERRVREGGRVGTALQGRGEHPGTRVPVRAASDPAATGPRHRGPPPRDRDSGAGILARVRMRGPWRAPPAPATAFRPTARARICAAILP